MHLVSSDPNVGTQGMVKSIQPGGDTHLRRKKLKYRKVLLYSMIRF
jgi:hypothetical protein